MFTSPLLTLLPALILPPLFFSRHFNQRTNSSHSPVSAISSSHSQPLLFSLRFSDPDQTTNQKNKKKKQEKQNKTKNE
jgi:hypothetical protein